MALPDHKAIRDGLEAVMAIGGDGWHTLYAEAVGGSACGLVRNGLGQCSRLAGLGADHFHGDGLGSIDPKLFAEC